MLCFSYREFLRSGNYTDLIGYDIDQWSGAAIPESSKHSPSPYPTVEMFTLRNPSTNVSYSKHDSSISAYISTDNSLSGYDPSLEPEVASAPVLPDIMMTQWTEQSDTHFDAIPFEQCQIVGLELPVGAVHFSQYPAQTFSPDSAELHHLHSFDDATLNDDNRV